MLTLYVDDSGKSDHSPVQILAGYLSTPERWTVFSREWRQLLDEAGIDDFKMSEAWRLARKYQKRGYLRRDHLIVRLVECIKRHVEVAFVSSIPIEPFHYYLDPEGDHSQLLGRPYFVGFYAFLAQVYHYVFHRRADQCVQVIFDEQGDEPQEDVLASMEEFRRTAGNDFGDLVIPDPKFKSDTDELPIQAADMLAWAVRRDAWNGARGRDRSTLLENVLLGELLSMPSRVTVWDERRLEFASKHLRNALSQLVGPSSPPSG